MQSNGANPVSLVATHTFNPMRPCWSPDGSRILFPSDRDGNREIYLMNADGSELKNLTNHPATDDHSLWSPDGSKIVFSSERDGNKEIYLMNSDGSHPFRVTENTAYDGFPSWSPRWFKGCIYFP